MTYGLEIETHQFSEADYVLIRVDVGKMPPQAARNYIAKLRNETALCKELDDRGIRYDLVGVRNSGAGFTVEPKKEPIKETTSFEQAFSTTEDEEYKTKVMQRLLKITAQPERKIVAERNDILKANLDDDLKKDNFADAMKLME